ncbi:MAG: D-tyrosyl-tRNA(Tyr) deacylase [Firmicutes bacterium]|nr:D-tyrosyl-tRNA(Tyr) deacylase [Bacillota bacterium]
MRAVIQRVSRARVLVDGGTVGEIGPGLMVLLGVGTGDSGSDASYLADKTANLRIFEDGEGKMNRSVLETGGELLVVSQFTLYGDCRKGRRPSFTAAAAPEEADRLYLGFVEHLRGLGLRVETGTFRAHMRVEIINEGPVTMLLDSQRQF